MVVSSYHTTYAPFGSVLTTTGTGQRTGYIGREADSETGLGNYGVRLYEPEYGRFMSVDVLWGEYEGWQPYQYALNAPTIFTDIDGRNPVFAQDGTLLGTDDNGLHGNPIIMNKDNFKQGMSYDDAMKHSLGMDGLVNRDAIDSYMKSVESLKDRPDWDGYLTLSEAIDWYRNGNGQPLFVALDKIDLSGIDSWGEENIGQSKVIDLYFASGSANDALVYGQITLKRYPNNQVRAFSDKYDFEMHSWNVSNWIRNIETAIGHFVSGQGVG